MFVALVCFHRPSSTVRRLRSSVPRPWSIAYGLPSLVYGPSSIVSQPSPIVHRL